jgi:hypothetical protein
MSGEIQLTQGKKLMILASTMDPSMVSESRPMDDFKAIIKSGKPIAA